MRQRNPGRPTDGGIEEWVHGLQARGRYTFDRAEAAKAFGRADLALTKALGRLARKRRIVSPRRGFYVIVPAEFSTPGSPPADWFIDDLMRVLGHRYYVGLLTAAAHHGAAHQQPQQFQVVAEVPLRPVRIGRLKIVFVTKAGVERCPVLRVNTSTGTMAISTPEVTALDLVRYAPIAGHLSNVATVLAELAEKIDPAKLVAVVEETGVEMSIVQRLGHLLGKVEMAEIAAPLASWVAERSPRLVALRPGRPSAESPTDPQWRVRVNVEVEPDL
ncbi:MAG: type IV toxin-antitoxin system AbiEi family antitoxin [Deltaproteobacteria bacterium]|nr:type IV toxin-antitoxin system AbiEi family antitoxin [Deltaproteobacteria bacterium]